MIENPLVVLFELTHAFDSLGIDYVVVGSIASSIHGEYRASGDIDIIADIRPEHLYKLHWYQAGEGISDVQWRDIRGIIGTRGEDLDFEYLRQWAEREGADDLLERALVESQ